MTEPTYLGDAVHAHFDGYGIVLTTRDTLQAHRFSHCEPGATCSRCDRTLADVNDNGRQCDVSNRIAIEPAVFHKLLAWVADSELDHFHIIGRSDERDLRSSY